MKIFVRTPIDEPIEIDVEPSVTQEQLKVILMAKYGFPMGDYRFVYGGKIIKEKKPLEGIPERSLLIVSIKQHQNMEIERPKPKPKFHTFHLDIPPNFFETKALYDQEIQKVDIQPTKILTKREKDDIDAASRHLFIKQAYMHNFLDHPEEAMQVSDILDRSPGIWSYITDFEINHFSNSLYHSPASEVQALVLTGILLPRDNCMMPDFDSLIMSIPMQKRVEFERVARAAPDKETALKIFMEHDLDVESSLKFLQTLNK